MRITLNDIATRLGVAKATVSMALHDSHHISVKRRREIQQVAKQMGYVPDPFLSGLAAHRRGRAPVKEHGVLAWVNHWENPGRLRRFREFNAYWQGAGKAAVRLGYRLDDVRWELDCTPKRFERILLARGIEGILIPPHNEPLYWQDFDWNKFPVIRFGMSVQNPDSNQVTSDIFRSIVMGIKKIHEYGYRRIGLAVNEEHNERLGGNYLSGYYYAQTLLKLKPALPALLTVLKFRDADRMERQKTPLQHWLARHQPDAMLVADIEMPDMMRELGYRIPQDIAVAGTSLLDIPADAGIDQRSETIGRLAVEMLVKQINVSERGEPRDPCRILVESRWRDGDSLPPHSDRITLMRRAFPAAEAVGRPADSNRIRITLGDIAVKVGASRSAVSMALRDSPEISPKRRQEIQGIATEMGYTPDPFLKGLAMYRRQRDPAKSQGVIAWVNHWEKPERLRSHREFELYWLGARQASGQFGYRFEEFLWPAGDSAKRVEQTLLDRGVLGLLIPPHQATVDWGNFDWSKFSLIRFGLSVRHPDSNLITSDHQRAVVMAARKIREYGYERIGLAIGENTDQLLGGNYSGGFMWMQKLLKLNPALPSMKLDLPPQSSPKVTSGFKAALDKWMKRHRPDAILTFSPEVPVCLRELGYRIPQDVAVAGTSIHDIPVDAGIDQHSRAIGRIAAEMLIKQISLNERGEPPDPCRILIESRWQDGKSLPPGR